MVNRRWLLTALINAFSEDEFKTLCFVLHERYDLLIGDGYIAKCQALIQKLEKTSRIPELIGACESDRPNVDWKPALGGATTDTAADALGKPDAGKRGILLDISHRQHEWPRERTPTLFDSWRALAEAAGVQIRLVVEKEQLSLDALRAWHGLILAMPYESQLSDDAITDLRAWAKDGGRIAVLGFELGPRHSDSNINKLLDHFGMRFNSDIAVPAWYASDGSVTAASSEQTLRRVGAANPPGWLAGAKPYEQMLAFAVPGGIAHPLLAGVNLLRWRNVCTLSVEPGCRRLVSLGENWLGVMADGAARYDSRGLLRTGHDVFHYIPGLWWRPVAACAHPNLTDNRNPHYGSVLAIGAWDLIPDDTTTTGRDSSGGPRAKSDNERFVHNLLRWLAGLE